MGAEMKVRQMNNASHGGYWLNAPHGRRFSPSRLEVEEQEQLGVDANPLGALLLYEVGEFFP